MVGVGGTKDNLGRYNLRPANRSSAASSGVLIRGVS